MSDDRLFDPSGFGGRLDTAPYVPIGPRAASSLNQVQMQNAGAPRLPDRSNGSSLRARNRWAGAAAGAARAGTDPDGVQLKAFMTPREIRSEYQALDGDREPTWNLERIPTSRQHPSRENVRYQYHDAYGKTLTDPKPIRAVGQTSGGSGYQRDFQYNQYPQNGYGTGIPKGEAYKSTYGEESDDQLFARKLSESQMTRSERYGSDWRDFFPEDQLDIDSVHTSDIKSYIGSTPKRSDYGSNTSGSYDYQDAVEWHSNEKREAKWQERRERVRRAEEDAGEETTLYDMMRQGDVPGRVSLQDPLTRNKGSQGKPSILGGHHRIAAMEDIDPDRLMPVVYHRDLMSAKSDRSYPYG